ncbi:MAG: BamA/TamA family outer membrane protein [Myxococcales bacterium]|nr:BamA/TamA family outer membrane protein [Myxococcales bacterium]
MPMHPQTTAVPHVTRPQRCWIGLALVASLLHVAPPLRASTKRESLRTDRQETRLNPKLCGKPLKAVVIRGLTRTAEVVVRRELLMKPGEKLQCDAVRESVQRLRNLGIFRRVDVHLTPAAQTVVVSLRVDEKWTLLPIFSAGRGGGRLFLQAGAQDSNLGGRYLQLQGYWWMFAGTHSAVIALTDPRLFHERFQATIVVEHGNRNRYLYETGQGPSAAWSRHRERVTLALSDVRQPKRTYGLQTHLLWDRFSTRLLSDRLKLHDNNTLVGTGLPADGGWLLASAWARLGRIDKDDYLERRGYVHLAATLGQPLFAETAQKTWIRGLIEAKWAWLATGTRLNLVARIRLGAQTQAHPAHRLFVGGLSAVRGYWEGRFAGERMATGNLEARLPSLHGRVLVLQHVVFADTGWVHGGGKWQGGVSLGTGVRIIMPLIARFVARLDVAWAAMDDDWRISFGSQQFF